MQPTQPPAGPDPLYGFAGCYRHPDRLTGVRCIRCNRPICPECQNAAAVGFQCPDDVKAGGATVRRGRTVVGAIPAAGRPLVTYSLIGLNVLFYVLTAVSPGGTFVYNYRSQLFNDWVMWPRMVGADHDYVRLMTSAFLHYGPIHILLNMLALYTIGPALETVLGRWRYLSLYVIAALGSSVLCLLFDTVDSGSAGASGAIFGLFAAALVLSKSVGFNSRSLWITIGINFIFTFSVPGISKLGHIGGFIVGGVAAFALLGWTLTPRQVGPRLRNIQLASLAAILVVLIGFSVWRTQQLHNQLITGTLSGSSSSTVWTGLGRTTPV